MGEKASARLRRPARRGMVVVGLLAMAVVLLMAAIWWVWLPHYRPGLKAGEVYGVEVSNHQGSIDWFSVADDNIDFAYIKATEGVDFVDTSFEQNWGEARAAGVDVGAYHFFTLCGTGRAQARNVLETVSLDEMDLPLAVDLELSGGCADVPPEGWVEREVAVFLEEVETATGEEVLLRVGPGFDDRYQLTEAFARPQWVRRILRRPSDDRWLVWHLSYRSQVNGIDGAVDLNIKQPD